MKENDKTNNKKKIILLNGTEIMRSILIRAIEGQGSMVIDREIKAYSDLGNNNSHGVSLDADWLISIEADSILPEHLMGLIKQNPHTCLMILASDGSQVMLRSLKENSRVVRELDFPDLIEILKNGH